jgi:signal transduction histidine kinase/DNA-binding response OmpR family regulator
MPVRIIFSCIFSCFLLGSCFDNSSGKKFVIGFSQCVDSDKWRQTMLEEMKRELAFHENITFIYKVADDRSDKQIEQVKELMKQDLDLLIISPNEAKPLTPVVEEVYKKGIPIIVIDRKVASRAYTAYIGGDNYEVGKLAGQYAVSLLNKKGTVTEVLGLQGSSPAIERHKGFTDALQDYPEMKLVTLIPGQWLRSKAVSEVTKRHAEVVQTDLVFAHNDMMAIGTREALEKTNPGNQLKIIGIDALPGDDAGLEFVADKKITASVLYPTGGDEAIRLALKILNKQEFKKVNILNTLVVDSSNVRLMKLQSEKIISQQQDIEKQQVLVEEQKRVYNNQRTFTGILAVALLLLLLLGGTVFYSWRKNKKITNKLQLKNDEISSQQIQLIEMSEKAEVAHQAKLNFFTNISHEFRTPLTLILSPLEEILVNEKMQSGNRQTLQLVHRNVMRLYRLVNQLMDFRKIEFSKMKIRASENDLVAFVKEITESYEVLARKKQIGLRFFTNERVLPTWFDVTMIDKVIFNLLSNAFKFTKENGFIHVTISKSADMAIIKLEDNGVGMGPNALEHAFEPFFQGEYENYKGSGLGLALSKEFIEMHHGQIFVTSEKWKGTCFEIKLPLGKDHLQADELIDIPDKDTKAEDAKMYTTELMNDTEELQEDLALGSNGNRACVLVIEDNDDLRYYLVSRLSRANDVLEAEDGLTALDIAFANIPDIIICDVMIPGKNGLDVTRILKNDVRTAHIPIILLTARNEEKQRIEGLETKADAYLTKPFNLQVVHETVRNLLTNREKMKSHYSTETFNEEKSTAGKKLERKFASEFCGIVENNLANEKFNVDDICKSMAISRIQLYRKVKQVLNVNVNDYIVNTRLQKAKYYMQHEDLSISEIAYKTGFSSAAYFSTVFKSKFGTTPSEFKSRKNPG